MSAEVLHQMRLLHQRELEKQQAHFIGLIKEIVGAANAYYADLVVEKVFKAIETNLENAENMISMGEFEDEESLRKWVSTVIGQNLQFFLEHPFKIELKNEPQKGQNGGLIL